MTDPGSNLVRVYAHTLDLTRHAPVTYSVIEEIVEGFVEAFFGLC